MKGVDILKALLAVYIAFLVFTYIINPAYNLVPAATTLVWIDAEYILAPIAATLAGLYAIRKYDFKSIHGRTMLLIFLGTVSVLVAETLFIGWETLLNERPFPSVADIFFILMYPLMFFGAINELRMGKLGMGTRRLALSLAAIIALSAITFYYGVYLAYDPEAALLENALAIGYGIGDIALIIALVLVINMSIKFKGGLSAKTWVIFALALLGLWGADILYAMFYDNYMAGEPFYRMIMDYGWLANYLLMAWFFLKDKADMDVMKSTALSRERKRK